MSFETYLENFIIWATNKGSKLLFWLVILCIGWKLIDKLVKQVISICLNRNIDCTLCTFLESFAEISLKGLLTIYVLTQIGLESASLAALVASAGLAVGLALQGSLSNLAGGAIILLFRPFKVNDYIETPNYSGKVESIKIFYTHLVTIDNKAVTIPNGTLANGCIVNYSAKDTRRVDLVFEVSYDSDVIQVKKILKEIADNHPLAIQEPKPFVAIIEHAASSIKFVVRVWTSTDDYWNVYYDLLEQVKIKFDKEQIAIPYQQIDIHMDSVKSV
ncbi:MAG: mechanosensitive ion channel [Clostridium sp.]